MTSTTSLEERIEAHLSLPDASVAEGQALLAALYERYQAQERLLERITRISDQFQRAERDRGQSFAQQLERKVRQIEKIVRISDRYQLMLRDLNDRLTAISTHDELTGLPNRRFMQERLHQEIAKVERQGGTFALALADVDHFKEINDSAGHACGDRVLAQIADTLRSNLREYDCCARWGGEEFLLLFPDCDQEHALRLAERIRIAITAIKNPELPPGRQISLSLGLTEYCPSSGLDHTLRAADEALYRAKANGRNRSEIHYECNTASHHARRPLP